MSRDRRSSSPQIQIERLQKRHAELETQLNELSERKHLSAREQMTQVRMKKEKLAAKDQLQQIKPS